jgi:hypothetical protein
VPDLDEQKRGFEAFRQAFTFPESSHRRIDGLYVWNWYGYGGRDTINYTPARQARRRHRQADPARPQLIDWHPGRVPIPSRAMAPPSKARLHQRV